jgi:predicted nucleic acid-binding protein
MPESTAPTADEPHRVYLDANVIRGQLTTNILLTLAERKVLDPDWSQEVLDEMRRNRPEETTEQKIDRRIRAMNTAFPKAMTSGYEHLEPQMRAHDDDKHVLAAAVHSRCSVLVTENTKHFQPPASGPHAMRVERLSEFLNHKLGEHPDRVLSGLREMVGRHRYGPQTMPALLDTMADQEALRVFAQKVNGAVEPHERGTNKALTAGSRGVNPSPTELAQAGMAEARDATKQSRAGAATPRQHGSSRSDRDRGPER